MNAQPLLFVVPFVVSLFAAGVNFGVWVHRREELAHRALAMVCASSALLLVSTSLLCLSTSHDQALFARSLIYLSWIPAQIGNGRLVELVYRTSHSHAWRATGLSVALAALGLIPGVLYGDGSVTRTIGFFGAPYIDVALTPLGRLLPLAFVLASVFLSAVTWKPGAGERGLRVVSVLGGLQCAAVLVDMLVLGGFINAPFVYAPLYAPIGVVYTALMLRHFVRELGLVETSADRLQAAAENRARALREADLRLAHGARLAALGTLAAGLAHEINNPAAFIRSNLNYLGDLAEGERDAVELEEVLGETEQGVARLQGIVDELLRMSAHHKGDFGEVLLSQVVESALPTLRFEAGDDIALEARLAPVPAIRGDRNLLGQIVANLVINAIQAVRGAGARGEVRITTFADESRAVLEVSDSGPGVPPELAQRIFEPFFTTKPAGEGTGLGLGVVRQLVERHGGLLLLLGSERGARFRVELPLARPAVAGVSPRTSAPATTDTAAADPAIPAA